MTDIEKAIIDLNIKKDEIYNLLKNTTDIIEREKYMKEIKEVYRRLIILGDIKNM